MKTRYLLLPALFILASQIALSLEVGDPAPPFVNPDLGKQFVWSRNYLAKGWVVVEKYQVTEIPSLFLVDPLGTIVFKEVGFQQDLYERISVVLNRGQ